MVAVVTGNGLGLFNTSLNMLGGAGVLGQGGFGQAGGQALVNASNGNLVMQFTDRQLSGLGLDLLHTRTYNTQGTYSDADGDGWRWDGERRVTLNGELNATGSSVARTTGDGHETLYRWNGSTYQSTDGDGAHDSLSWDAARTEWVWTDGSRRTEERYTGATGRLAQMSDAFGTRIDYSYDEAGRLNAVKDASGQELVLVYNTAGRLERLDTRSTTGGALTQQVYYSYDAQGRLASVATDLTPADNSISDGQAYITTYTYDGASFRIASVSQSDGSSVNFTYELVNGEYRVKTVIDASGTTTFSYDPANRRTDISNGLNQQWSYFYDEAERLIEVRTPAVNGQRISTLYSYDTDGNVTQVTDGRGNILTYGYDSNGNRVLERDTQGNTLRRIYDANNQLLNEIRYSQPATWTGSAWSEPPASSAQVVRYAYDANSRLRYVVSAGGVVTEYRYNGQGMRTQELSYGDANYNLSTLSAESGLSEAQLSTWAAARDLTRSSLTELTYDYRGNLQRSTRYAQVGANGAGVQDAAATISEYIYSGAGNLLQTLSVRGSSRTDKAILSSFSYDGLGRLLSQTDASGTRAYAYDGAGRTLVVSNSAGLTQTQAYDAQGRLLSLTESAASLAAPRITRYIYDAAGRQVMVQDATGVRSYTFYDEAGRISAQVNGVGAVIEYRYNKVGQKNAEVRYATLVDTSTWYSGGVVTKTLVSEIRPASSATDRTTSYTYDLAGRLSTSADASGYVTTYHYDGRSQLILTQSGERSTRTFYDADGRVTAVLDGEGFLRENVYDASGRLKQVVRYALPTTEGLRAAGSLEQLRPVITGALSTWYFYDALGRQVGNIDEQGFVSETVYDDAGNRQQNIRYLQAYSGAVGSNFAAVKAAVGAGLRQTSTTVYDSYGRVSQRISTDGTVTAYEYDNAGRLIREIRAQGTAEARTSTWRYDALGQMLGKLTGEGSSRITAGMTESQIITTYSQYGLTYTYDEAGRQMSVSDPTGNTILSYYDAAGRLVHTVNRLGEVTETTYNSFGEIATSTRFYDRLGSIAGLTGGLLTTPLSALTQAIRNRSGNSTTRYEYDQRGKLIISSNALGYATTYYYNRYGEQVSVTREIERDWESTTTNFSYNKRGELIGQIEDIGGVERSTSTQYDAFGRVVARTDGRGLTSTIRYDNGGRVVVSRDPLNQSQTIEYDALGRVLTQTDALGRLTSYAYDEVNRTLTQTLPDGVQVQSIRNRHDELLSITDGNGNTTTYTYDKNGQLKTVTNALGQVTSHEYNRAGLKSRTIATSGQQTLYTYDVIGRTLTVTDALNVSTHYVYDGMGRKMRVTEAAGTIAQRITDYAYDCMDQVATVTQDPNGLGLTTTYSYDGLGRQLEVSRGTVSSPNQQVTRYQYDHLGRRTSEHVDPNGLNLTTYYVYNQNDQVEQKIQVLNATTSYKTLYAYDNAGRLISTTDALGYKESYTYDAVGNRKTLTNKKGDVWTFNYDSLNRLTEEITPRVSVAVGVEANGNTSYNIRHLVTKYTYDNAGNVASRTEGVLRGTVNGVDDLSQSRTTRTVYDALGRTQYSVNALNQVSETIYNGAGLVRQLKQYDKALSATTPYTADHIASALSVSNAQARITTYTYDAVGRTLSVTDAAGSKEIYTYDTIGNRLTLKNKNGHVWQYKYDSVGRLTEEISPVTGVTILTPTGAFQEIKNYLVVTSISYDAMGNVVSRSEGRLRETMSAPASSDNMSQARTTVYRYDAAGRQVQIVSPGWYNKALGRFVAASDNTNDTLQIITKVEYDALGNAISNRVQVNNTGQAANDLVISHKRYDALGRVLYDIDAMGGVISYGYDALGNQTSLTRHANAIDGADISRLQRDASQDRTISTSYDALGRKTEVRQPKNDHYLFKQPGLTSGFYSLTPTTQYRYNAFGELVKETLLGVFTNGTTMMRGVETTYYYDNAGRQVGSVDAKGYYTKLEYDAYGSVTRKIEYATALTKWNDVTRPNAPAGNAQSPDRSTRYTYDAMGRVTQTIQEYVRYWIALGEVREVTSGNITSSTLTYDAAGNIIASTDALGATTTNIYDSMGRLTRIILPQTTAAAAGQANPYALETVTASPISGYAYNAFGQVVLHVTEGGTDANGRVQAGGTRYHITQYDIAGNAIMQMEPSGSNLYFKVDAAGRRIEEKREVDVTTEAFMTPFGVNMPMKHTIRRTYEYDKLGQQVAANDWYNVYDILTPTLTSSRTSLTYNRFGEVTEKRVNGVLQEKISYDLNGRVLNRVTTQVGIEHFAYDVNGKLTYSAQYGNLTDSSDDRITYYLNDQLGRAVEQHLPAFEANTSGSPLHNTLPENAPKVTPIIRQVVDRWGNVLTRTDAKGYSTSYRYDHENRLITETGPDVTVYRENGTGYIASIRKSYGYDVTGNLVVEQDIAMPVSGTTTVLRTRHHLYAHGNLVWEIDGVGSSRFYIYDIYGNRLGSKDALGNTLFNTYDAMDRLTSHGIIRNNLAVVLQTNKYDQAGRLYAEVSGTVETAESLRNVADSRDGRTYTSGVAGNTRYTIYDERGNITWARTESGVDTRFQYDAFNRKVVETDGAGNTKTWTYSAGDFSLLTGYKDWGNHYYSYTYNGFGQLTSEYVSGGPEKTYTYFANGLTKFVIEGTPQNWDVTGTQYDLNGNKTLEFNNTLMGYGTPSMTVGVLETRYQYDALNRLQNVSLQTGGQHVGNHDLLTPSARLDSLSYYYDEFGNRRRVTMDTTDQVGKRTLQDNWFKYDLEGRVLINDGYLNSRGQIVAGVVNGQGKGQAYGYNAIGQRISSEEFVGSINFFGYPSNEYVLKNYTYNDLGSLLTTTKRASVRNAQSGPDTSDGSMLGDATLIFSANYDARNNRVSQEDLNGNERTRTTYTYRGDGKLNNQLVDRWNGSVWKPYQYTFFNESRVIGADGIERDLAPGYDAAGLLVRYRYTTYDKSGTPAIWGDYYTTFIGFSSWKEQHIFVSINRGTAGNTAMEYSARGDLLSATATGNTVFTRRYASDRNGQLIMRTEGNNASAQTYVMHNGNVLASVGNNSTPEIYDTIASISPNEMERAPTNYVIVDGDTLQNIAQKIWGDSSMWYLIADANGLSASSALERGTTLTIPNIAGSHSNNADTFKAYDASEVSGDLTPAAKFKPPKPKKKKSGGLGSIVMVVVAVVAAVFTAGAALAAMGAAGSFMSIGATAMAGGGIGAATLGGSALAAGVAAFGAAAAVGSAASQLAGMAMGVQDKFSWSQVAAAGITGGITGGVGSLVSGPASTAITASAGYVGNYAASKVVGLDASFSWSGMAASVLSSMATSEFAQSNMGRQLGMTSDNFKGNLARGLIGSQASASIQRLMGQGGKLNYVSVAADAFGNAIGNGFVEASLGGNFFGPKDEQLSRREIEKHKAEIAREATRSLDYESATASVNWYRGEMSTDMDPYAQMAGGKVLSDWIVDKQEYDQARQFNWANDPFLATIGIATVGYSLLKMRFDEELSKFGASAEGQKKELLSGLNATDSDLMAAATAGTYAVYGGVNEALQGGIGVVRLSNSSELQAQAASGLLDLLTTNPLTTFEGAKESWYNLPSDERGFKAIAALATLGASSATGVITSSSSRKIISSRLIDGLSELDPRTIRTTQTTTKKNGATLRAIADSMKKHGFVVEPDKLIDVIRMPDGGLTSLDNTRIIAADMAGVKIQARVHDFNTPLPNDEQFISRFIGRKGEIPETWGDAVKNRISHQSSAFRNMYPHGSPFISLGKNYQ